jgi:hypothetical protein
MWKPPKTKKRSVRRDRDVVAKDETGERTVEQGMLCAGTC